MFRLNEIVFCLQYCIFFSAQVQMWVFTICAYMFFNVKRRKPSVMVVHVFVFKERNSANWVLQKVLYKLMKPERKSQCICVMLALFVSAEALEVKPWVLAWRVRLVHCHGNQRIPQNLITANSTAISNLTCRVDKLTPSISQYEKARVLPPSYAHYFYEGQKYLESKKMNL